MKWSKLKQMVEKTFSEAIQKKVAIHMTSYGGRDGNSRSWIVVGGEEKISFDFTFMLKRYLQISAHQAINSEHPLLRAFGVLNKKVGKEKVKALKEDKHPMVAYFAQLRYESDYDQ